MSLGPNLGMPHGSIVSIDLHCTIGNIQTSISPKIFFSETTRPIAVAMANGPLHKLCHSWPWVKFGHATGADSHHRPTTIGKPSSSPIDSLFLRK